MDQSIIEAQAAEIYKQSREYAVLMQQIDLLINLSAYMITRLPQDERVSASNALDGIKEMC